MINIFERWAETRDFRQIIKATDGTGYNVRFSNLGMLELVPISDDETKLPSYFDNFTIDLELMQKEQIENGDIYATFKAGVNVKGITIETLTGMKFDKYVSYQAALSKLVMTITNSKFYYRKLIVDGGKHETDN